MFLHWKISIRSWTFRQPQSGQILPFQVEGHRLLQITDGFIQRFALCHNRDFNALGDIPGFFATPNYGFNGMLERFHFCGGI